MDRVTFYPSQILTDAELLQIEVDTLIGLGWTLETVLGPGTYVYGLGCTPTSPASLQVQVAAGAIYADVATDATAFGSLGTNSNVIKKQGLSLGTTALTLTAPATSGQSVSYLVQVAYSDVDGNNQVLSYFNSASPSTPFTGPGNSGASQPTTRQGVCVISLLAGAPATTGSQTTPSPSSGYTGLYVITLAYGQTTITAGNITTLATAPFLTRTLGSALPATPSLFGLTVSNDNTSPNTVFDVAAGGAIDKTGALLMKFGGGTKTFSNFAIGNANGSLDTGTVTAGRWYHVHLIYNPATGLSDILTSLSYSTPALPSGYTYFVPIWALYINSSVYISPFTQVGSTYVHGVIMTDVMTAAFPSTTTLQTLTVATGCKVKVRFRAALQYGGGTAVSLLFQSADEASLGVATNNGAVSLQSQNSNIAGHFQQTTNTSGQIKIMGVNGSSSSFSIDTFEFDYPRGAQA